MFRAAPGNVPSAASVIRERLRAATGEPQLVCNDSGVCPCDGFYGASSPCALSFSASRCFSGSVMMPNPFPLRSKTWFPTWKDCCPCLPNMPWTDSNRMKRKRCKKRRAKRKTPRKPTSMRPIRAIPSNRTPNREKSSAARSRKAIRRAKSLGTGWTQTSLPSCSRRPSRYMP